MEIKICPIRIEYSKMQKKILRKIQIKSRPFNLVSENCKKAEIF